MQRKLRILECIRQGQIGGGESHLLCLVEHLDRERFEPVVLSFTPGPMVDRLQEMGVDTHVIYTEKPFDVRVWRQVRRFLKQQKVDLIHAHGTRANSNIIWAARSLGIPVIYTVHGWSFHQDQHPIVRRIRILGEKLLTSTSSLNISVSDSNRESGRKVIPSFRSVVVNNGIDRKRFNPNRELKDVRAELGIPADKFLVLFMARFTGHKQPLTLIRAFQKALQKNPDMVLLMVGDGDEKEQAKQLLKALNLEKDVILHPFRHDVPDVLAAADLYVLPSLWEGLPIGLLEAMSMGKAVVATQVDGTKEVVLHRENGLLTEPGNIDELANAIVKVATEPSLRDQFRQNALNTVKNRFCASEMTKTIQNLYLDVWRKKTINLPQHKL